MSDAAFQDVIIIIRKICFIAFTFCQVAIEARMDAADEPPSSVKPGQLGFSIKRGCQVTNLVHESCRFGCKMLGGAGLSQ